MGKPKTTTNDRMCENLGRRLQELREQANLSRQQLADKAGVHYDVISRIERDDRRPVVTTLARIANGLDLSMHQLLTDPAA